MWALLDVNLHGSPVARLCTEKSSDAASKLPQRCCPVVQPARFHCAQDLIMRMTVQCLRTCSVPCARVEELVSDCSGSMPTRDT
eukprot:COSAG02_NODE_53538_length_301_cov_0.757426_1_plen_83_part_10